MLLYMLNTKFLTIQQYSIEMSLTFFLQGIGVTLLEIETKKDENYILITTIEEKETCLIKYMREEKN